MLRLMRENTGSWIIKIILGLIVLVFVFLGMGSMGSKTGNQVALVNDVPITMDEFRQAYQNVVEEMRRRFGDSLNDELLKLLQVKKMAMDRLIEERLISQEADELGVTVSARELQSSLAAIPAFQKEGRFDLATYRRVLSQNRLTPETFEVMQKESLRQARVRELILRNIKVSDLEVTEWYRENATQVSINYLFSDPDGHKGLIPDDARIQAYYDKNKENYQSPPTVKVQYLAFSPSDFKKKVSTSSEQIAEYYRENKDMFSSREKVDASHILIRVAEDADPDAVAAAEKQAREVYDKAVAGEDFAELAKAYSQDMSKETGGYLGTFEEADMVKPFGEKAFSMAANEISEPVRTMFGWHVIKVNARIDAATRSLAEVSEEIKTTLETAELKNYAYDAASKAFDAVIDGDDLEQAALISGVTVQEAGPFDVAGPKKMGSAARSFAGVALSLPVGEISDVKEVGDGFYIIRPFEKTTPETLPLETVRDEVVKAVTAVLQDEAAKKSALDWLASVTEGKSLASVGLSNELSLKSTELFGKQDTIPELGRSPEIVNAAFKLAKDQVHPGVLKGNDGYYLIALKEKKIPGDAAVEKNREDVKKQLKSMKQNAAYSTWVAALKNKSTIQIEPEILK